jgi:hypothetical protein
VVILCLADLYLVGLLGLRSSSIGSIMTCCTGTGQQFLGRTSSL